MMKVPVLDASGFLNDLGKATKRGIKKCPKCGIYNGTRGILCKNKDCDAVFKDNHDRRKSANLDAVLLSGIVRKVYSVRVRDGGPDCRGFVHLSEENVVSLCFVDSCQRLFDDSILKCHEENQETATICPHIEAAMKSTIAATPVQFKFSILATLRVGQEMKKKIWELFIDKEGALVQRVSRSVMAVKCLVTPKHPLGYLHVTFGGSKKFHCSCMNPDVKCVHYYACICALASDAKFAEEFQNIINSEFQDRTTIVKTVEVCKVAKVTKTRAKPRRKPRRNLKRLQKLAPYILPVEIRVLEADGPVWKFTDWLSTVTELINNTMQLQNYGNVNNLQFFIPQTFYDEFRTRIPDIYNQYHNIYHIMNIQHLKQIFDTPLVKLKISKRFILTPEGYFEYSEKDPQNYAPSLIFFLNVGQSTVDESEDVNNPFVIEWTALNVQNTGELKFQFKYGRKST